MRHVNTHTTHRHSLTTLVAGVCLLLGWLTTSAAASTVKYGLSPTTSWVGSPIVLNLVFENITDHQQPVMPNVPGLHITSSGTPSRMSSVQIINGRRTEEATLTYRYLIDATTPGRHTLPAMTLHADDKTYPTEPVVLTFLSSDDDNLLRAEIQGVPSHGWLGDTVPVTLQILMKPYKNSQIQDGVLSASDMWRQVQIETCRWGPFLESVAALQAGNRFPKISIAPVKNATGEVERWYAYDIEADLPLLHAGELDLSDIMVRMNYPMQIGRGRTSFFDPIPSLTITQSRPVTACPTAIHTLVDAPPSHGQPDTWAGAVGQYAFDVTANPTDVVVGEPITLTMRITDRGNGRGDLNLLQAPRLERDKTLAKHFRVPDERPGGVVSGNTKIFTQTIRPTSVESTVIPAIPFAFFNTQTGSYETSLSRPIPLSVTSAKHVDASAVAGVLPAADSSTQTELTAVRGGLLANYTDPDMLLAPPAQPDAWWFILILLFPPVSFTVLAGFQQRRSADRDDPRRGRARKAGKILASKLEVSGGSPEAAATALRGYVADRLGLPAGGLTSDEAVQALRHRGQKELAEDLGTLLQDLERRTYAGGSGSLQSTETDDLRQLAKRMEACVR
jgi:hypothetical protein